MTELSFIPCECFVFPFLILFVTVFFLSVLPPLKVFCLYFCILVIVILGTFYSLTFLLYFSQKMFFCQVFVAPLSSVCDLFSLDAFLFNCCTSQPAFGAALDLVQRQSKQKNKNKIIIKKISFNHHWPSSSFGFHCENEDSKSHQMSGLKNCKRVRIK